MQLSSCVFGHRPRPRGTRARAGLAALLIIAAASVLIAARTPGPPQIARPAKPPAGPAAEPIRYTLRFPAPSTGYVEVEAAIPTGHQAAVDLMMAVWTPGSYLVREYERHVEALAARRPDGTPLAIEKTRKNRWRVEPAPHDSVPTRPASAGFTGLPPVVTLTYRLYCREMTVRHNWVEEGFAMLNGAPTFLTLADGIARAHDVRIVLPAGWRTTVTPLPAAPGDEPHHYLAPDYDTLVDSPIIAGNPSVYPFDVDNRRHLLVNTGDDSLWDTARTVGDMTAIVAEWRRMWGFLPYSHYHFLNVITETGGGLEHRDSTLLMSGRAQTRTRRGYVSWLTLVSHEFLHAWNVKRLRSIELGPFDYDNENYTCGLWVAEGFTDYYGELALPRAKVVSTDEYLQMLTDRIEALQTTPGRLVQPLQQASFDAWIKEYRPDESTVNSAISYYTKGGAVAFLLDAKIRRATGGARSLDDGMRLAYERYSGTRGFTSAQFRATMAEVAGVTLDEWFARAVDSTAELDYAEALAYFGLRFRQEEPLTVEGRARARIGVATRTDAGRLVVSEVARGTPAWDAGVNAGDEIVALGGYRVFPGQLEERVALYEPGNRVSLLVARRERLVRLEVTLGAAPARRWTVEVDPGATPEQQAHLRAWLRQEDPARRFN